MKELQNVKENDSIIKYKKHFFIDNFTKEKVKNAIKNAYELLKTGILFCLLVLILRKPEILSTILAPTIIITSGVLKIIGIIVLILILFNIFC